MVELRRLADRAETYVWEKVLGLRGEESGEVTGEVGPAEPTIVRLYLLKNC